MKAELTFTQLCFNTSLREFFFREQAWENVEDLLNKSEASWDDLDNATEEMDLDEVEEMFYSESLQDCADTLYIELNNEN